MLFSIGGIQILIILLGLGRSKTLSWLLGPDGFGVASTFDQVVSSVVQFGGLSLQFTALRFMSAAHSAESRAFQQAYVAFLKAVMVVSVLAAAAAIALLGPFPGLFGRDLAKYHASLRIALLCVPPAMLNIFFMNALAAGQLPRSAVTVNLGFSLTAAAAAVAGVLLNGIPGLYAASAAATVCVTLYCLWYTRQALGLSAAIPATPILEQARAYPEVVSTSLWLYLAISSYSLAMLVTRYYVISRLGEAEAGWLQASLGIALSLGAVMSPMNGLYLAPLMNRQTPPAAKILAATDFARKTITVLLLAALPLVLFPVFFSTILYTGRFRPVAETLFLFVAWQCLVQVVNIYHQVLIGLQDIPFFSVTTCLGYGITALLSPVLIPGLGLRGAALALSAGSALMWLVSLWRLQTRHQAGLPAGIVALCGYSLVTVLLPALLPAHAGEGTVVGLAIRAAYLMIVPCGLWFLVEREDRRALVSLGASVAERFKRSSR